MFESKTVFVVGAGASAEVGLPIGRELTAKIANLLNIRVEFERIKSGDYQIYETLKRTVQADPDSWQGNSLIASARHIGDAMQLATSIDTFLESFNHDKERMLLGKLGIAKAILMAERASKLAPAGESHKSFSIKSVANTWYVSLAQLLFSAVSANDIDKAFENVSFIVFNYDRCLQIFLIRALEVYFQLDRPKAEELLQKVKFLHPYGSVGTVFGQRADRVSFGADDVNLADVANRIVTFSETVDDQAMLAMIRNEVRSAETLVFLGFGYHQQNFDILSDHAPIVGGRRASVLGTTLGLSNSDTNVVRSMISNLVWNQPPSGYIETSIHTFNGTCQNFFGEFWRSLTAGPAAFG
jgi:hypothetical protein